ncbi:hypothetical protein D3C84_839010 [compost metagenome]
MLHSGRLSAVSLLILKTPSGMLSSWYPRTVRLSRFGKASRNRLSRGAMSPALVRYISGTWPKSAVSTGKSPMIVRCEVNPYSLTAMLSVGICRQHCSSFCLSSSLLTCSANSSSAVRGAPVTGWVAGTLAVHRLSSLRSRLSSSSRRARSARPSVSVPGNL